MNQRNLRIAWSVAWGIAAVLLIALWVRSYFRPDRLHVPSGRKDAIAFASKQGRFYVLSYQTVPQPNAWKSGWYSHSVTDEEAFPQNETKSDSKLGFGILRQPPYVIPQLVITAPNNPGVVTTWNHGTMYLKGTAWMIPDWFLVLLALMLAFAARAQMSFSLRTLLIATTLVAVALGLIVWAAR